MSNPDTARLCRHVVRLRAASRLLLAVFVVAVAGTVLAPMAAAIVKCTWVGTNARLANSSLTAIRGKGGIAPGLDMALKRAYQSENSRYCCEASGVLAGIVVSL